MNEQEVPSPEESEYKLVTILFADVVGSTALGAELDSEMYRLVMDRCLQRMSEAVNNYGGTIARLMGDGVLAFFGAPQAHEDDPERAALAAGRIHELVDEYAHELGHILQVRVGLNTGRVVVGALGGEIFAEYTAMGMPVNLAARLESAAQPGQTLAGETTARLISNQFIIKDLKPLALKGFLEPVPAFEIIGLGSRAQLPRGLPGLDSPLVGRDIQRKQLAELLVSLETGRGAICSLIGEPGIGKSRLLQETKKEASDRPVRWMEGRSYSYTTNLPFSVAIDLLFDLIGVTTDDVPAMVDLKLELVLEPLFGPSIGEIWPFLAVLIGAPVPQRYEGKVRHLPPVQLNAKISSAIRQTIEAMADQQPLAISFEDLHWADESSLTFIQSLMLSTERSPLLIFMIFRPERAKPVWKLKVHAETDFAHRYLEINLRPLDPEASRLLVENLLRVPSFPSSLRRLIRKQAEGNPFFVEELIRDLIERGILVNRIGRWEMIREVDVLGVPDKVEEVIQARLDRLEPGDRSTLQAASVIGRRFSYRLLETVIPGNGELAEQMLRLQRSDLVRESARIPELEYTFKHALVQETTYRTLLKEQQITFHRLTGEALEKLSTDRLESNASVIGRHFEIAGMFEKAVDYLLLAGRRAARLASNQEAVAHLRQGLVLLESLPEEPENSRRELELLLALGPPLQLVKWFSDPEVEEIYKRARNLRKQAESDPQLFFPPMFGLWSYYQFSGDFQIALELAEQLLDLAEQSRDSLHLLQGHHGMWTTRWVEGSYEELIDHAKKGMALYEPRQHRSQSMLYGSHDPAMCSRGLTSIALCALGYPDQALEWSQDCLRESQELPHPFNLSMAHFFAAIHGHLRRDAEMTRASAESMIKHAEDRIPPMQAMGTLLRGWALTELGYKEEGLEQAIEGFEQVHQLWGGRLQAHSRVVLAEAYGKVGKTTQGLARLNEALEVAEETGEQNHLAEMHRLRGEMLLSEGAREEEVEEQFISAIGISREQNTRLFELRATMSLYRLRMYQNRQVEAREQLKSIYIWFSEGFDTADLIEAKALLT